MLVELCAIPRGILDIVGMVPFDAFIVSASGAECLGVPHDGAILFLLADNEAAEEFASLDIGVLISAVDLNTEPDATKHSCEE